MRTMIQTLGLSRPILDGPIRPKDDPMLEVSRLSFDHEDVPGWALDTENDRFEDGKLVGAEGATYDPHTPLRDIPAVTPSDGSVASETVLMVNGIMTDVALQELDLHKLADCGYNVIGIHNATRGMMRDLAQCVGDKLDLGMANNHAVDTLAEKIEEMLADPAAHPKVFAHSQGALVVSNALGHLRDQLLGQGHSQAEVEDHLSRLHVTTLGGASWTFPAGPGYEHFINNFDCVPMLTGMGGISWLTAGPADQINRFSLIQSPSRMPPISNGLSNYMARAVDRSTHGPQDVYLPEFRAHQRG